MDFGDKVLLSFLVMMIVSAPVFIVYLSVVLWPQSACFLAAVAIPLVAAAIWEMLDD